MKKLFFCLALLALMNVAAAAHSKPIVIGVLEHYNNYDQKGYRVRVVFKNENKTWVSLEPSANPPEDLKKSNDHFLKNGSWYACYQGKPIGQLKSKLLDPVHL